MIAHIASRSRCGWSSLVAAPGRAGVIGSFLDSNPTALPGNFTATITWGNGQTSSGVVTASTTTGLFVVSGTNLYTNTGIYPILISVQDNLGDSINITSTALVNTNQVYGFTGGLAPDREWSASRERLYQHQLPHVQRDRCFVCDCAALCPILECRRRVALGRGRGKCKRPVDTDDRPTRQRCLRRHRRSHNPRRLPQHRDDAEQPERHQLGVHRSRTRPRETATTSNEARPTSKDSHLKTSDAQASWTASPVGLSLLEVQARWSTTSKARVQAPNECWRGGGKSRGPVA